MNQLALLLFLFCMSTAAFAAPSTVPSSQPETLKVVTLSFNTAVIQTAEAQKELNALKTKYAPRQAELQTLSNEVDALRKQLSNSTSQLTDADRATRERSLDEKEKQLQRQAEDFKSDSQSDSQQVFQKVAQKLYGFLQTYSKQHGYSLVIDRGSDAAPVVWYAANDLDITAEVIKAYDAQSGAPTKLKALPDSPHPHP